MSEILAWATAIFDNVKSAAWRSHITLAMELSHTFPAEDLWLTQAFQDRLTYPFCVNAHVMAMLQREAREGRKADWFMWLEDDIVPPPDLFTKLREAADPKERPFVAALAYARTPPFGPGIVNASREGRTIYAEQWRQAPSSGVHPVDRVGMCASLIHRSIFDILTEPWFRVLAPKTNSTGLGPDALFADALREHGIQPYVSCDVEVGHIASGAVIGRQVSERLLCPKP